METFPDLGMKYEQVATRLKKDKKYRFMPGARASLLRQCQLCEGEKATQELIRDVSAGRPDNCSKPRHGYNPVYASRFDGIRWHK
jgi:hypothetical protein